MSNNIVKKIKVSMKMDYSKKIDRIEMTSSKELTCSEGLLRFQKQQVTNLQVKEEMARELAAMELPEDAVNQILHIEDEVPF
jgi:hypothetical protein